MGLEEYAEKPFGHVLFIRHAIAPGYGDPNEFRLGKCETQRNLDAEGRKQAREIGLKLIASGVYFDRLFSSQWCPCIKTAELLGLGNIIEEPSLNSFFQGIANKGKTLKRLRKVLL